MGDELKVTQADLEASAKLADALNLLGIMQGIDTRIDSDFAKGAFARHRIATETQSQATIDELVAGLAAIVDGEIERPLGTRWREDKTPSKLDRCIHHVDMRSTCGSCIDAHVLALLAKAGGQS